MKSPFFQHSRKSINCEKSFGQVEVTVKIYFTWFLYPSTTKNRLSVINFSDSSDHSKCGCTFRRICILLLRCFFWLISRVKLQNCVSLFDMPLHLFLIDVVNKIGYTLDFIRLHIVFLKCSKFLQLAIVYELLSYPKFSTGIV